ncbi:MAG: SAM-dependent chlorinase/fluorinase, partial [Thermoplasmata archaeon]|nr:SAM-dependent chlorinase/fluorinase [Thermoplasmata archaeon]
AAVTRGGARGTVVHIDHFGNAITNIPSSSIPASIRTAELSVRGRTSRRVAVRSIYEELPKYTVGLLGSSFGTLELAVREGSATARLRLQVGHALRVRWRPGRPGRR